MAATELVIGAGVHRLTEERDARLLPQTRTHEQGRVARASQRRPRRELHRVVHARELVGRDLHVELERGVERFEQHVVVRGVQRVDTADGDPELAAAHPGDALVQCRVARRRRHVVQRQVVPPQRRQDADCDDIDAVRPGCATDRSHVPAQVFFDLLEAGALQLDRVERDLDVVARELGLVRGPVAAERLQDLDPARSRPPVLVDEEELLLQAHTAHALLEHVIAEHPLERVRIGDEALLEAAQILRIVGNLDVVTAHGRRW